MRMSAVLAAVLAVTVTNIAAPRHVAAGAAADASSAITTPAGASRPAQTWTRCLTMFGISAVTNDIEYRCKSDVWSDVCSGSCDDVQHRT